MIGHLTGKIIRQQGNLLIVQVGGVGYRVMVTPQVLDKIQDNTVSVYTFLKVAENELTLFGLPDSESLTCMEMLMSVSGVGPRLALVILSHADPAQIYTALSQGDGAFFTRISGVGKKLSERILVELKDKSPVLLPGYGQKQSEVSSALESLGYNQKDIRLALTGSDSSLSVAEQIKAALKKLSL